MLIAILLIPFLFHDSFASVATKNSPLVVQESRQKFKVSLKVFEEQFQNPTKELKTFSFSPSMENGPFSGIKVNRFSTKCRLPLFGIQEEDTIESINGTPLRLPTDIYEIGRQLQKAKAGHKIRVSIYRNSKTITNTYLLTK
ncbi:MAG: hypothetical protein M9962_07580 [Oligoflexia bacterium]|nr:hypothetical protein [Oligoflexia bacterium]